MLVLVGFQFYSRILTFILGNVLLRYTSPEVMGLSSIQFDVFTATTLFLSREAIRLSILRVPKLKQSDSAHHKQLLINISYLVIPCGLLVTLIFGAFYWFNPPNPYPPGYHSALSVYIVSCCLEFMVEPLYCIINNGQYYEYRVIVDGSALFMKSGVNFMSLYWKIGGNDLMAFAFAQLVNSISIVLGYLFVSVKCVGSKEDWPLTSMKEYLFGGFGVRMFDPAMVEISWAFFKQNVLKHFLTQGDLFILSMLAPLNDQGVFAVVNNYGSLVARIIFQPLEEISRGVFGKLFAKNQKPIQDENNYDDAFNHLATILKLNSYIGLMFVCIGSNYTDIFVTFILGSRWTIGLNVSMAATLSAYCYYILLMGINGIMESFVHAVMTRKEADRWSLYMVILSAVYIGCCIFLINRFGSIGLIAANCINMMTRIVLCYRFIYSRLWKLDRKDKRASLVGLSLWQCLPQIDVLIAFFMGFFVTSLSAVLLGKESLLHLAIGVFYILGILYLVM